MCLCVCVDAGGAFHSGGRYQTRTYPVDDESSDGSDCLSDCETDPRNATVAFNGLLTERQRHGSGGSALDIDLQPSLRIERAFINALRSVRYFIVMPGCVFRSMCEHVHAPGRG